jgi:hypothetical protein
MVERFKPLFEFRACFLPKYEISDKDDKGTKAQKELKYRPIAIGEQPLLAFHKVLKNRLMQMYPLSDE